MLGIKRKLHLRSAISPSDYNNKVKELQTMTTDRDNQKKALADKTTAYNNKVKELQTMTTDRDTIQNKCDRIHRLNVQAFEQAKKSLAALSMVLQVKYYDSNKTLLSSDIKVEAISFTCTASRKPKLQEALSGQLPVPFFTLVLESNSRGEFYSVDNRANAVASVGFVVSGKSEISKNLLGTIYNILVRFINGMSYELF